MLLNDKRGLREPGLLSKTLALIGGVILLILGFMFSLVLLAVAVLLVAGVWGYLWWKTREIRRRLREAQLRPPGGTVFDGEATRVDTDGEVDRRP